MTDAQKKPSEAQQAQDKVRYERQIKEFEEKGHFTNADGSICTATTGSSAPKMDPRKKFGDDVVQPKKPLSPYIIFVQKIQADVRKEMSESTPYKDVIRKCGEKWKQLSEEEKKPYMEAQEKDKQRYQKELNHLMTHGYFLMEDGSKSSDYVTVPSQTAKKGAK